jgi:hypothetical protein
MGEHVLLFCLLGLVLTATIILVVAPGAVTFALSLVEWFSIKGQTMKFAAPDSCLDDYEKRRSAFLKELIESTPNVSLRAKEFRRWIEENAPCDADAAWSCLFVEAVLGGVVRVSVIVAPQGRLPTMAAQRISATAIRFFYFVQKKAVDGVVP